ncbi:cytochrome P450 [Streptomyces morookaense]|uniref:Cytochrome P450 n=1 Tax=Streptomyces morookaense TaxID=1970 RepID=A0A7Y7B6Y4_STRMO|nr:cytochrome P450 [Streptomyces morookaense]NVK79974.1 cytochrome P450 [Streptomyces morookaense]GHF50687.1 cytochrome P450 monooxygenase [Streptomyces morookaense]
MSTANGARSGTGGEGGLPVASAGENLRLALVYFLPDHLKGVFRCRPRMARLMARLDPGRRRLEAMRGLRRRHGRGPVVVHGTCGPTLLVLDAEDARQVLSGPVDVYAVDTWEKVNGFAAVQPDALVASHGRQRTARRAFNDAVLDAGCDVHRLAGHFLRVVGEEARRLLGPEAEAGLTADVVRERFERIGRRCFLGEAAADDTEFSRLLGELLAEANWMGARRWRTGRARRTRRTMMQRQSRYLCDADPRSLTGLFRSAPRGPETAPESQLTQWFMALAVVHSAVVQTLALLATHPEHHSRAAAEVADADRRHGPRTVAGFQAMPYVRACIQDAARLWAPVPSLLRRTTAETRWRTAVAPGGMNVLVPAAFHARDDERLDYAHRFAPEKWMDGTAERDWAVSPFSRGEARCSGMELGLLLATGFVAEFLRGGELAVAGVRLTHRKPLPHTFDTTRLRIGYRAHRSPARTVPPPVLESDR